MNKSIARGIVVLCIAITTISCETKVKDGDYSIPVHLKTSGKYRFPGSFCYEEIEEFGTLIRTKVSSHNGHLIFQSSDVEIELRNTFWTSVDGYSYPRKQHYLIGAKDVNSYLRAFFIVWTNRSTTMDTSQRMIRDGREVRIVDYSRSVPWEIGEFTDSLQTNLKYKEIKKLYPKFRGVYTYEQPDSIVVHTDSVWLSRDIPYRPKIYTNGRLIERFRK